SVNDEASISPAKTERVFIVIALERGFVSMQLSIGARAQGWSDGGHSVADCHAAHDTGNRHSRTRMAGKTNPAAAGCTVAFGNDLRHSGALSAAPVAEPGQPEHQQRGGRRFRYMPHAIGSRVVWHQRGERLDGPVAVGERRESEPEQITVGDHIRARSGGDLVKRDQRWQLAYLVANGLYTR
ncbi:MAG TPA: hypothetical protein PLX99_13700, partial [Gammaproteobacteria bacterium]|nr:hypothetical protein [Gammaproteobacteria bacterium]